MVVILSEAKNPRIYTAAKAYRGSSRVQRLSEGAKNPVLLKGTDSSVS